MPGYGGHWDADPLGEIDRRVDVLNDDRTAWQHQQEDANRELVAAEHVADRLRAQEQMAREHVHADTAEIALLREERALIVPDPRTPS
jgi:hypothetical protein